MLQEQVAPVEDESMEEQALLSRVDLIGRIRVLEEDIVEALSYGFNLAVQQVQAVNPGLELVTSGIGPFHRVVDGKIVSPEV